MEHILYWLWLVAGKRIRRTKILKLFCDFESVENIYLSKNFHNIKYLTEHEKLQLADKSLDKAERILETIAKLNAKILVYDDKNYPQLLKNISNPPLVLYIQGKVPELDEVLTIGIVGTRKATEHGMLVTDRISRYLAKSGVVTIGGLAEGIDAAGAWATIEEGGIAVAVIGNGLDIVYPPVNAELYRRLAEYGCIMTEYPPGSPPIHTHFPARNRIIAGISRGVLVTEAPQKSGALITARLAMENNRDVFAIPRDISKSGYLGTNILIQQGAKLINNPQDILCEYPYFKKIHQVHKELPKRQEAYNQSVNQINLDGLEDSDRTIAKLLLSGERQVDELARELKLPVSEVSVRLTMLEMKGIVKKLGNQYKLKL